MTLLSRYLGTQPPSLAAAAPGQAWLCFVACVACGGASKVVPAAPIEAPRVEPDAEQLQHDSQHSKAQFSGGDADRPSQPAGDPVSAPEVPHVFEVEPPEGHLLRLGAVRPLRSGQRAQVVAIVPTSGAADPWTGIVPWFGVWSGSGRASASQGSVVHLPTPQVVARADVEANTLTTAEYDEPIRPLFFKVEDIDGDGREEAVVVLSYASGAVCGIGSTNIRRYYVVDLEQSRLQFELTTQEQSVETRSRLIGAVVVKDLNGDGAPDLRFRRRVCVFSVEKDDPVCERPRFFDYLYDREQDTWTLPSGTPGPFAEESLPQGADFLVSAHESGVDRFKRPKCGD